MTLAELGPGPARLGNDPAATIQREAGYQLTDFHALFREGAQLQATDTLRSLGPLRIEQVGEIELIRTFSGHDPNLAVFDPGQFGPIERTLKHLNPPVRPGVHPVFAAFADQLLIAAMIRFDAAPVDVWTPALDESRFCPTPPQLPLVSTRSAFGLAGSLLDDEQARPVRPDTGSVWGDPPRFIALEVGGAGSWPSWFGLGTDGAPVAWVIPFEVPRFFSSTVHRLPWQEALKGPIAFGETRCTARLGRVEIQGPVENIWIETMDGREIRRSSGVVYSGGRRIAEFGETPEDSTLVVELPANTFPALPLDVPSVERQFAHWRDAGAIDVDHSIISKLAERFAEQAPKVDARSWLALQPEVTRVQL